MKNNILTIVALLFVTTFVNAQEEAVFKHHHSNSVLLNPATVGLDREHHNITMNIRSSWAGFPGAPKTYALTYNGAAGKMVGIGGMLYTESVADVTQFRGQLGYSMGYKVENLAIRAGMSLEYHRTDVSRNAIDGDLYDVDDSTIERGIDGEKIFDTAIGLYASFKDKIYVGYTAPNLIRTVIDDIEGGQDTGGNFRYYILHAGGNFDFSDLKIKLQPSIVLRKVRDVDTQVDVSLLASFLKEQLITGLMYRAGTGSSVGVVLGTKYNSVKFLYSFDFYTDTFQDYSGGAHEITVGFQFARGKGSFDRSKKYRK